MQFSINVIVAYSDNLIIGNNNDIPWLYKEDLQYFENITTKTYDKLKKNVVIMGNNTYNSLNLVKLKNRVNIVITTKNIDKINNESCLYFVDSLGKAIEESKRMLFNNEIEKIFIIGGESIYTYFFKSYYYKFLDKIYITRIHKSFEGNKFFYGLEEKFYYTSVQKSILYPEIEYRVLQYEQYFTNVEKKYLDCLKYILRDDNIIYDIELKEDIVCSYKNSFELEINLKQNFPLFSFMKDKKDDVLTILMSMFQDIEIKNKINEIIINKELCSIMIKQYNSIYHFNIEDNNLSCIVEHNKGNMINEVVYNIMFTSLMVIFMSKIMKLEPYMIKYKCNNNYYLEKDNDIIEKIAWNVPDVLPLLKLNDKNYKYRKEPESNEGSSLYSGVYEEKYIEDYNIDDLIFLGLKI